MFIELVESNRKEKRSLGGTIVSVTLHTGLIFLAIAATANARTERAETDPVPDIVYVSQEAPAKPTPQANVSPRPKASTVALTPTVAPPIVAPITVATGIPEISPIASAPDAPVEPPGGTGAPGNGAESPSIVGPYTNYQVDKEVRAFPSNRSPVYPDALRARGIEGEVYVRFVVDVTGRVDMKSVEILSASNEPFVNAVRYSLERARFQPAEAAGHKVAQLVEQHFQFRLDPQP